MDFLDRGRKDLSRNPFLSVSCPIRAEFLGHIFGVVLRLHFWGGFPLGISHSYQIAFYFGLGVE